MRFRTDQLAADLVATHHGPVVTCDGVVIDSRLVTGGELFVAVVAERDGHQFVPDALRAGAAAILGSQPPLDGATVVAVGDTSDALTRIGVLARERLAGPVIGVTGSVGKTSVKDLCAAAIGTRLRVAASEKSFNNELGVPLTLANAPEDTEVAVVEMGARGPGHIAHLCAVASPTIGIVTAVVMAHTEFYEGIEGVARTKGELVEALPAGGTAVLNADDPLVAAMATRTQARVLTYGTEVAADLRAERVAMDAELRPSFLLHSPWGTIEVRLAVRGRHQVGNALAAAGAALVAGVELDAVAGGLAAASLSPWRMEVTRTAAGVTVINDAYNANPTSMTAALRALAALPARRRVAVLGRMTELGPLGGAEHAKLAVLCDELAIDLLAVGTGAYGPEPVPGPAEALVALRAMDLADGDAVLVKGSRVAGLENLAAAL